MASLCAAGFARSAAPAFASTAIERADARSSGCCSEPTTAPGHRATSRLRASSRSTAAAAISALGPLQRPSGTAVWPSAGRSASESAPQRLPERFPNPRVYSRVPPENPKQCPKAPFLSLADAKRFATPASLPRTTIRHRRSVCVVAPASASRPRLHRPHHRRCKSPTNPCIRPPRKDSGRKAATTPNSLRPVRADRQVDSKKPPRYTRRHRIGPLPGGFLFPEWVALFTGIRIIPPVTAPSCTPLSAPTSSTPPRSPPMISSTDPLRRPSARLSLHWCLALPGHHTEARRGNFAWQGWASAAGRQ